MPSASWVPARIRSKRPGRYLAGQGPAATGNAWDLTSLFHRGREWNSPVVARLLDWPWRSYQGSPFCSWLPSIYVGQSGNTTILANRSEERRVGKEFRSWWWWYH